MFTFVSYLQLDGASMESFSVDSVLESTTDCCLLVAKPETCRSAAEICLSSLRHKRSGTISKLSPGWPLVILPGDSVCVWLLSVPFMFLSAWQSEGRCVWCVCLFMWESLCDCFLSDCSACIFLYVVGMCVLVCTSSVWLCRSCAPVFILCIWLFSCECEGWSPGCTASPRVSLSFFLSCRLELL